MKNYYTISRKILCILAVIISLTASIHEDISVKIVAVMLFFLITLAASFFTTPISKKVIHIGDSIANTFLRILFYCSILPLTLLIAYILYALILCIYDQSSGSINAAALTIFLYITTTIVVIVPYIQTLTVLILRKMLKDNNQ